MEKEYVLVALPYPSSSSLHVGHYFNYAIMDSYCRWLNYKGIPTFLPFGYDSFGIATENYARKVGRDPQEVTDENIKKFRAQMETMNTKFQDLIITSHPSYYKWTQWIFTQLYNRGLAYKGFKDSNWCESCATVISNEQVIDNKCERCGNIIEIKPIEQWFFKITDYKDRLIKNLEWIDYPEKTKKQQLHWLNNLQDWSIGRQRKWGCPIPIEGETQTMDSFVDSSWYFIRYCDPDNDKEICSREKYKQVDLYVIGNEHATSHLIYARFINMFLYDIGVVPNEEPFKKLIHQGMILKGGEKMSKSKGNVVNPDDYDSDEIRFYMMFLGHYFDGGDWSDQHIIGVRKFLNRWDLWISREGTDSIDLSEFIKQIDGFTRSFKFNKVVSSFMEFYNKNKDKSLDEATRNKLRETICCFAPTRFKK